MIFDYLKPAQGPVIDGLEDEEKIYALSQAAYLPLRTLAGEHGISAIYRCELTPEQRQMITAGADIMVEILHGGGLLAPSRVMILNQSEPTPQLIPWLRAQLKLKQPSHPTADGEAGA